MTPDLLDLARVVVTSPHWRWMPGMRTSDGYRLHESDCDGLHPESYRALPDLTDPATLGCLLALYEETRQVRTCPDAVYTSAAVYGLTHPRTVAVLVAALLAAPAPVTQAEVP